MSCRMAGYTWPEPPERPDDLALGGLRDVGRSESRIAALWLAGGHFKHQDGRTGDDATVFVVVLDFPIGDGTSDEQIRIITKLDEPGAQAGSVPFGSPPFQLA